MGLEDDAIDAAWRDFQKKHGTKLSLREWSKNGISGKDFNWLIDRARKYLRIL